MCIFIYILTRVFADEDTEVQRDCVLPQEDNWQLEPRTPDPNCTALSSHLQTSDTAYGLRASLSHAVMWLYDFREEKNNFYAKNKLLSSIMGWFVYLQNSYEAITPSSSECGHSETRRLKRR